MSNDETAKFHAPGSDPVLQVMHAWYEFLRNTHGVVPTHIVIGQNVLDKMKRSLHLAQFKPMFDPHGYIAHINGMEVVRAKDPEQMMVGVLW